jgi:predicted RecA/RadA family phage recombinase
MARSQNRPGAGVTTPATRTLTSVLRTALQPGDQVRLLVGTAASTPAGEHDHLNVTIEGVTVSVPKLKGVTVTVGAPVYLLATSTMMLAIGTVSATP